MVGDGSDLVLGAREILFVCLFVFLLKVYPSVKNCIKALTMNNFRVNKTTNLDFKLVFGRLLSDTFQ